ncbi:ArsR/SmtB family transcription factor [Streptomyces sp. NPDC048172]|uniref:ArsR/SmtB family transcription factor n=1 Tax=Streptomyces sp. NPDC048172 TaxID=3365505 RepID=UPI003715B63B
MALRIHFTTEDLLRTRLADEPHPLLETFLALHIVQGAAPRRARFDAWRIRAAERLEPRTRTLFDLTNPVGGSVDFLHPVQADNSVDEVLETVRGTPASYVRSELQVVAGRGQTFSPWLWRMVEEPPVYQQVVDTFAQAHEALVAAHWPGILQTAHTALSRLRRTMAEEGLTAMLRQLDPRHAHWSPPVLEVVTRSRMTKDEDLGGRGLLLIPSVFGTPTGMVNPKAAQPWMTFPIPDGTPLASSPSVATATALGGVPQSLATVLGRTRATVLWVIAEHPDCTTKELARHARIAPPSASEHATILRNAGLTSSTRHHNAVHHTVTAAGVALLDAGQ